MTVALVPLPIENPCLCGGICKDVSVVFPPVPLIACAAKAVVNATEPPDPPPAPFTIRMALLLCVVTWVHPVGADGWNQSVTEPEGMISALVAAPSVALAALASRSEEHTSELQSHVNLVCRLLLEK